MILVNKTLIIVLVLSYIISVLSIIPTTNAEVMFKTTSISVGGYPTAMAYDPKHGYVYVVDSGSNQVSVISSTSVVATIPVGSDPVAIVYNKQNGLIYVANFLSNTVSVINGTKVIATVEVGGGIGYSPVALLCVNGLVYVANLNSYKTGVGVISVINGTKVVSNIQVDCHPICLTYDPNNGYVYVSDSGFGTVSVIKGDKVVANISVGKNPTKIVYDPYVGLIYVVNKISNSVSVIKGTSVIATINVPYPVAVAYSPSYVYVVSLLNNSVYVIDGTRVVSVIPVGKSPFYIAYNPYDGLVYVANVGSNSVSVINSTKVIYEIPTGKCPRFILPTPSGVYVSASGSNEVIRLTVTSEAYYLTFRGIGLPSGKPWTVCVNGVNKTSTSNEITFVLPPGTYNFKVYSKYYIPTPSEGVVTLTSNKTIEITFTPVKFNLTFKATGLPKGESWTVFINNENYTSTAGYITISLPMGVYEYKVFSTHYVSNVTQGVINLTRNEVIYVKFTPMNYTLTVAQKGLPSGHEWVVSVNGSSYTVKTSEISITLPYGNYVVKVYSKYYVPTKGEVLVDLSKDVRLEFTFVPENFTITFEQTGLPSGTPWTVCVNGKNYTTTSQSLTITLPYGNYTYRIFVTSNGYSPDVTQGVITLTQPVKITVTYKQTTTTNNATKTTPTTTAVTTTPTTTPTISATTSATISTSIDITPVIGIAVGMAVVVAVAIFLLRRK